MANYFARKAGNIDATDVWATTPTGTAGPVTFQSGDVLYANSFAIAVNVSTNLGSTGEVRNDNTNSATAGGTFTLSNGVTLTTNVITGSAAVCVTYAGTSGNSASIVGNVTGGSGNNIFGVNNTSGGTLNITGNVTAGVSSAGVNNQHGVNNAAAGTINITGNCTGAATGAGTAGHGANIAAAGGTINITGNCTGGAFGGHGANNANATGTLNITGNCTGGAGTSTEHVGANNNVGGSMTIIGNCIGGPSLGAGARNVTTGTMIVNGSIYASETTNGVSGGNRGQITRLTGPFYTTPTFGVNPIGCLAWRWDTSLVNTTFIEVPTQNLASKRNLVTPDNATNFPSASSVRNGITYGISNSLSGTCAVPPNTSVRAGVPVDNTTGTIALAPEDIWNVLISSINTSGSIGARLKNASTISTTGQQLADALDI